MRHSAGLSFFFNFNFNFYTPLLFLFLKIILGKLSKEDALAVSDRVMTLLLSMFQTTSAKGHVEEDALLAITALINALEHDFIKYMDAFKPYLVLGLKNHQAHQV